MRYLKTPLLLLCLCPMLTVQAQLMKKLKEKVSSVAEKVSSTESQPQTTNGGATPDGGPTGNSNSTNPRNSGGAGLITTPPDVKENLADAETSFGSGKYSEARYAVQQAMLGVELQIGQSILKSLPKTIAGLNYDSTADQVTSSGWGWAGLTIYRQYTGGEKQLKFSIVNNSAWMQAVNMYFNNAGYAQQTGGQQNWKQTKIKGIRAVIEYNESSGYKLSAPLGQTSLLVYEGINFANEGEFMKAAEQIDIDKIKKQLGEK